MKYNIRYMLLLIIMGFSIKTQAQNVLSAEHQKVLNSQSARFTAMINTDMAALNNLVAGNLSYGHTTGRVESKSEFLAGIESNKVQYLSLKPKDTQVSINKKTAIVTGLVDAKLQVGEKLVETTIRFLEVYERNKGEWQLSAWQAVRYVSG